MEAALELFFAPDGNFPGFFPFGAGCPEGLPDREFPGNSSIWEPPEDIFLRSHPNIRVKCGLPLYQMDNFQGIFNLGRGGDVVGVTPRIVQVDILAKVHKIQEFLEESDFEKTTRAKEHVFLHRISMRVLLA